MSKNQLITVSSFVSHEAIVRKIYLVRGEKAMLDRDLADLYQVETRVLNQAVRRNMDRFPADFMFTLTRQEIRNISQSVISLKHAPNVFAFTEKGVAMLSSEGRSRALPHQAAHGGLGSLKPGQLARLPGGGRTSLVLPRR